MQCRKPSTITEESIVKSRAEHIKHLLETGAVKDWNRDDAIKIVENEFPCNVLPGRQLFCDISSTR